MLVALAALLASADAVMALGPEDYAGIVAADVVTLLSGTETDHWQNLSGAMATLLDLPVWMMAGVAGLSLLLACRKRPRKRHFSRR